MHKEKAK